MGAAYNLVYEIEGCALCTSAAGDSHMPALIVHFLICVMATHPLNPIRCTSCCGCQQATVSGVGWRTSRFETSCHVRGFYIAQLAEMLQSVYCMCICRVACRGLVLHAIATPTCLRYCRMRGII